MMPWAAVIWRQHLECAGSVNEVEGGGGTARFYRCMAATCGLRFPVMPADLFHGVCPRCKSAVKLVAERLEPGAMPAQPPVLLDPPLHLLLDNWRSSFNVGSALRTADGVGASLVHLCGITPTPDAQRKVAKTALGAETAVPWRYHPDAVAAVQAMQAAGAKVWCLEATAAAVELTAVLPPQGCTLVLVGGNEVAGVDPGLLAVCDQVVALPMRGVKRSLNVAIALSLAAYWLASARDGLHRGTIESEVTFSAP